jgi:hypothetical protein
MNADMRNSVNLTVKQSALPRNLVTPQSLSCAPLRGLLNLRTRFATNHRNHGKP